MAMNMETMKAAKALADIIKDSDCYKNYEAASKEYEGSAEIMQLITEYNVQQVALTEEYKKAAGKRDEMLTASIQNRINELYTAIMENPVYEQFKRAGDEYEAFYNEIITEINYMVTGQRPSCSGDCSSCGGCH